MIKPTKPETYEYELAPKGTHLARVWKIAFLGTQKSIWEGKEKELDKLRIWWELPEEAKSWEVEENGKTVTKDGIFSISKEYTFSMGDKSNLRPIVEGIIGSKLSDDEAWDFDIESIIGMPCLIRVSHQSSKDGNREFAKVESTSELMKSQTCPPQVNETVIINASEITAEEVEALPDYLRDAIKLSPQFSNRLSEEDKLAIKNLRDNAIAKREDGGGSAGETKVGNGGGSAGESKIQYPDGEISPDEIPW